MANDKNAFPDLIEVLLRVPRGSNKEDIHDVRVELRINSLSLETDDNLEFLIELDRANLSLDLDGLEVMPKTRHGEPTKQNDVSIDHKLTNQKTVNSDLSGKLEGKLGNQPSATLSASMSGNVGSKTVESVSSKQTHKLLRVKARGNLTWEITEPLINGGATPLADTYLNDDVLCKVKAVEGANQLAVRLESFARKRDIRITPRTKGKIFEFKSKNHEKVFKTLVAKSIGSSETNGGTLTFSVSEVVIED